MKNLNGYQMFVSSIFFSGPLSFKKTDIKIASNQSPQSGAGGGGALFCGFLFIEENKGTQKDRCFYFSIPEVYLKPY